MSIIPSEIVKQKGAIIMNLLSGMTIEDARETLEFVEGHLNAFCRKTIFSNSVKDADNP
ncbi:MAG: hypothetical protein DDT19_02775 [Syntrophomonadaceae bacterium]|nr:hypothetical protein [Bacillota bacterium]